MEIPLDTISKEKWDFINSYKTLEELYEEYVPPKTYELHRAKMGTACWVCHARKRRCVPTHVPDSCQYCLNNGVPCVSQEVMATTFLTYCPMHKKAVCKRAKCEYSYMSKAEEL